MPRRFDPATRPGHPAQHRCADRPEPSGDRRRHLGQAAVGRAEPDRRRPARRPRPDRSTRSSWSARSRSPGCSRPAQRRDRPAACRVHPLADRRAGIAESPATTEDLGAGRACACWTCRRTRPAPRSPNPSIRCLARPSRPGQTVRPTQPALRDRKTGEHVDLLFAVRGTADRLQAYINNTIIPMLARKAGVPAADVRGNITSHRARSTIASQLYNAKEPMTLFELQAWLGHRSPQSTQYYAKISPEHPDPGLHRRRVLLPQRAHRRSPHRP